MEMRKMRLGPFYFPSQKDLVPLSKEEVMAIEDAVSLLRNANLPHGFYDRINEVEFFSDPTLKGSAILGQTTFFRSNRVILSPTIVQGLGWKNTHGVPNNELHMSTVIHELTHLQQFRDWKWYGWIIVHLPFLDRYTVEKWANQNGEAAHDYLSNAYQEMKRKYILERTPRI
jgi:hypothetical protein